MARIKVMTCIPDGLYRFYLFAKGITTLVSSTSVKILLLVGVTEGTYWDEILYPYVRPYLPAIFSNAMFMSDNARVCRFQAVSQYVEHETLLRMHWTVHSTDLNPLQHVSEHDFAASKATNHDVVGDEIENNSANPQTLLVENQHINSPEEPEHMANADFDALKKPVSVFLNHSLKQHNNGVIRCPTCEEEYCDSPAEEWTQCYKCQEWWHEKSINFLGNATELCTFDEHDCGYTTDKKSSEKWEHKSRFNLGSHISKATREDHTLGTIYGK
ncbi:uncharacterized protein TNCV_2334891 [Trichonephila clavipes]|uniref:MAM domain-containing protein n=1 Tax=Trichonephila clavipes TaxID=2585209 RepID=A0A8X6SKM2_TRICX|nr:uncharacterized protein TNCV_2334891 [Trichonephila clavipes]